MGSNCTSCKKPSSAYKNKHTSKNNSTIGKNVSFNNSENKINLLNNLRNYKFFINTKHKTDFFIECDLLSVNSEEIGNIAKYLEKWVEIISLSRTVKKASYQNLISEKDKEKDIKQNSESKNKSFNNKNQTINNNQLVSDRADQNKEKGIDNNNCHLKNEKDHDVNNENNLISNTNNFEIKIFSGRDKYFSDLTVKLQIAFMYNKDRFIKYLSKGPPNNIRWAIWLTIALTDSSSKFLSESEYLSLTTKTDSLFQQNYDDQIKKDIKRSNIGLEYLTEKSAEDCLYRILKALALSDPELGYCQGMNIITANLLMLSDCNELETFNMMFYLLQNLELREFFLNGFPKLLMFIFIFREFIKDQYPVIHGKLEFLDIPEELWVFKWLQTLFFMTLPLSVSVRIMDCVLCFGLEFLLNYSLSFVKENEAKILQCQTMESFIELFKGPEIEEEEESTEDNRTNEYYNMNDKNTNLENTAVNLVKDINENKNNEQNEDVKNQNENEIIDHVKIRIGLQEDYQIENNIKQINQSPKVNAQRKLSYFKNFDFSNDIILYRENLVREAKSLCIRDHIDKIIESYSQNNHNPLFNFNPNNVLNTLNNQENKSNLNTLNNYYDYQKTVNFEEYNFDGKEHSEKSISAVSSPKSCTSLSYTYTSRSIKEELSEYEEEKEDDDEEKEMMHKQEGQEKKDDCEVQKEIECDDNLSRDSNNDLDKNKVNDEIPCKINKYRNIRLSQENIAKDFGFKKSIIFNSKNGYMTNDNDEKEDLDANNNKPKHFSNLNYNFNNNGANRKSKFKNFSQSKDTLLSYGDRGKSVHFDISPSNNFFKNIQNNNNNQKTFNLNTITESDINQKYYSNTSKMNPDVFEFSLPNGAFNNTTNTNLNNNLFQNTEDKTSFYTNENLANTYNNTERDNCKNNFPQLSEKISGDLNTNATNTKNKPILKRFKTFVRQSLSINFGRKLNLDQILMMNKIKSKMSIIQSMNKRESKKNSVIEKINSGISNQNLNLNLSSGLTNKEKNKSVNTEDLNDANKIKNYFLNNKDKFEQIKTTPSDYILSTSERKIPPKNDPNPSIKLGSSSISNNNEFVLNTEPPVEYNKIKEFNLNEIGNNYNSLGYETEGNSPYKRRHTSMPFMFQSPFGKRGESSVSVKNNSNLEHNNNGKSNKDNNTPFNFKIQKDSENSADLENSTKIKNANKNNTNEKTEYSFYNKNSNKIKNNHAEEVPQNNENYREMALHYNFNEIIIEEEPGLGNADDD